MFASLRSRRRLDAIAQAHRVAVQGSPVASTVAATLCSRIGGRCSEDCALHVGDRARRTRRISARDIELFTELTGDRNPLHYDETVAARSPFGGIIVQGGVTSGLLNALVAEDLPGPGSVFLHVDWNFRAPVRPGDEITAEGEITSVRSDKPICTMRMTITNQNGIVVLDGTSLVYRSQAG